MAGIPILQPTQSYAEAYTGNGYDSSNAYHRKYASSSVVGNDITIGAAAGGGTEFTIVTADYYCCSRYDANTSVAAAAPGMSVNSNQLNSDFDSITFAHKILANTATVTDRTVSCSQSRYFAAGDIIRPHDGFFKCNSTATGKAWMRVERVGRR